MPPQLRRFLKENPEKAKKPRAKKKQETEIPLYDSEIKPALKPQFRQRYGLIADRKQKKIVNIFGLAGP